MPTKIETTFFKKRGTPSAEESEKIQQIKDVLTNWSTEQVEEALDRKPCTNLASLEKMHADLLAKNKATAPPEPSETEAEETANADPKTPEPEEPQSEPLSSSDFGDSPEMQALDKELGNFTVDDSKGYTDRNDPLSDEPTDNQYVNKDLEAQGIRPYEKGEEPEIPEPFYAAEESAAAGTPAEPTVTDGNLAESLAQSAAPPPQPIGGGAPTVPSGPESPPISTATNPNVIDTAATDAITGSLDAAAETNAATDIDPKQKRKLATATAKVFLKQYSTLLPILFQWIANVGDHKLQTLHLDGKIDMNMTLEGGPEGSPSITVQKYFAGMKQSAEAVIVITPDDLEELETPLIETILIYNLFLSYPQQLMLAIGGQILRLGATAYKIHQVNSLSLKQFGVYHKEQMAKGKPVTSPPPPLDEEPAPETPDHTDAAEASEPMPERNPDNMPDRPEDESADEPQKEKAEPFTLAEVEENNEMLQLAADLSQESVARVSTVRDVSNR